MTLAAGTKLGRYEIRSQLGADRMGMVYRARDTELGLESPASVMLISTIGWHGELKGRT